jgi:hypothetical protein
MLKAYCYKLVVTYFKYPYYFHKWENIYLPSSLTAINIAGIYYNIAGYLLYL